MSIELESFNRIQNCKSSWETWICTKLYHLVSLFSSGGFSNLHFCNLIELLGELVGLLSPREPKLKAKISLMDLQPNRAERWLSQSSPQSLGCLCNPSSWNRFQIKALNSCSNPWPPALDPQHITWLLIWIVQAISTTAPLPLLLGLRTHMKKMLHLHPQADTDAPLNLTVMYSTSSGCSKAIYSSTFRAGTSSLLAFSKRFFSFKWSLENRFS